MVVRMSYGTMGGEGPPQDSSRRCFSRYVIMYAVGSGIMRKVRWLLGRTWGDVILLLNSRRRNLPNLPADELGNRTIVIANSCNINGHAGAVVLHHRPVHADAATYPRKRGPRPNVSVFVFSNLLFLRRFIVILLLYVSNLGANKNGHS